MLGRTLASLRHGVRLGDRNVVNADFARGGDVPGLADLDLRGRRRHERQRPRILEPDDAAREVGLRIATQLEPHRLGQTLEPDATGHAAARAVINLPAEDVLVDSPGHE
jgi:hypothetical protein